ncbi:YceH family protein [Shewanella colwelliana]|uniref:YceH family protein n=1 Tax=Shewanella colwelliana TaxID=23 RepID=UPI003736E23C
MNFNSHEARIIGCLLEKEKTTPEQYPLSLNGLTLACNQKSSREPVMNLSETEVQIAIDSLTKKRLISEQTGFGSRVIKYKHRFCNTEFCQLQLNGGQVAVICLLLLRGPQTAGELRTRSNRLHHFNDVAEVEQTLHALATLDSPMVTQLAREPGKRECRFAELLSDTEHHIAQVSVNVDASTPSEHHHSDTLPRRVEQLEQEVAELKHLVAQLIDNQL